MDLNIKEINLTVDDLDTKSIKFQPFNGSSISSYFSVLDGLMYVYYEKEWPDNLLHVDEFPEINKILVGLPTTQERYQYLLKRTVLIHELRHFYDSFCSPYGFFLKKQYVISMKILRDCVAEILSKLLIKSKA